MNIGDKVTRYPETFGKHDGEKNGTKAYKGVVTYVHPKGRFHTVEFTLPGGKIRESFRGIRGGC